MHVLYLIAMYGNEYLAQIVHREIGYEFQKRGHTFSVFALAAANEMRGRASDVLEENILVHRAVAAGKFHLDFVNQLTQPVFHYSRFANGLISYTRYLRRHPEIDLVLVEGAFPLGGMAAMANWLVRKPFVVTVFGGDFIASDEARYGYGRFASARALMRLAFRRAAALRATTPLVREHIIRLGGSAEKISVVARNLANYSYLPPDADWLEFRQVARQEVGWNVETPVLLCAGRLLPIKGFDDAVRALATIRKNFPSARLVFLGPNRASRKRSYQNELETLAEQLGVRAAIHFAGVVEHAEMPKWLAAADLLLVPSIVEGMSRVTLEAAAVGTPTIISRTAGIAEALLNAKAGLVVEPRAPDELAEAVSTLLREKDRQRAMGRAGITFANRFRSACIGEELVALCERALADD